MRLPEQTRVCLKDVCFRFTVYSLICSLICMATDLDWRRMVPRLLCVPSFVESILFFSQNIYAVRLDLGIHVMRSHLNCFFFFSSGNIEMVESSSWPFCVYFKTLSYLFGPSPIEWSTNHTNQGIRTRTRREL